MHANNFNFEGSVTGALSGSRDVDWYEVEININNMVYVNFSPTSSYNNIASWSVDWYDKNLKILSEKKNRQKNM